MTRRNAVGLGIAVTVTVAVIGAVWRFGVIPVPDFPSLGTHPDFSVPGSIAFNRPNGDRDCVAVIPAGGGPVRELACEEDGFLRFEQRGNELAVWTDARRVAIYDPTTGQVMRRETLDQFDDRKREEATDLGVDPGPVVTAEGCWDNDPGVELVSQPQDGPDKTLVSVRAPRDYCFDEVVVSADHRWFVVVDSDGRLLVGRPDLAGLRLLTTGAKSYDTPVWLG